MEKRISSVVAAAAVVLTACLTITIQPVQAAPISWEHAGMIAGAADLADLNPTPTASKSAATNALFARGLTGSGLLLEGMPPDQQGLLGTFGYLQGTVSPGRMMLNGSDLMPLYEHSIQGRSLDPHTESEWQEVSFGIDALQALALRQPRISAVR